MGKYLRLTDRKILDSSYDSEIKFLEPRLEIKPEGIKAILEEVAKVDPRAKQVKVEDLIDRRYLENWIKVAFSPSSGTKKNRKPKEDNMPRKRAESK